MSNKKYRSKITDRREFPRTIETTVKFRALTRTGQLDVPDMHNLYNRLAEDYPDALIMIRAMNGHRQFTFKGYDDIALNVVDFEEYYQNTVREIAKFEKFDHIEISVKRNKTEKELKKKKKSN